MEKASNNIPCHRPICRMKSCWCNFMEKLILPSLFTSLLTPAFVVCSTASTASDKCWGEKEVMSYQENDTLFQNTSPVCTGTS